MKIELHSIDQGPSSVPQWRLMMDDLCNPPPGRVARVLGIGKRSVQRYNATGHAPRVVCLAVFWLTRWGRSAVYTQAHNDAQMLAQYAGGLERQVEQLETTVQTLRQLGTDQPLRHLGRTL